MSEIYNSLSVADYLVKKSTELGVPMSNLRLQKCLYFVQGLSLAIREVPAFSEEIEAWHYGPVVREVYRQFADFGALPIPIEKLGKTAFEIDKEGNFNLRLLPRESINDETLLKIIESFLEQSRNYSDFDLVELTHRQEPWRSKYHEYSIEIIDKDTIKKYFAKLNGTSNE